MRRLILCAIGVTFTCISLTQAQEILPSTPVELPPIADARQDPAPKQAPPVIADAAASRPLGFWFSVEQLLWWVKRGPVSYPLVTTTNSLADLPPGALNQPGTVVLFGDQSIRYGMFNGLRVSAGQELSGGLAVEINYFVLERRSSHFNAASDAAGNPPIGIAIFNSAIGIEDSLLTSNPDPAFGAWNGRTSVISHSRLQGWDLNLSTQRVGRPNLGFSGLVGLRAMYLNEDLIIANQFTPLVDGVLTFGGLPVTAGTLLSDSDVFRTGNQFYGGQFGGRVDWQRGPLAFSLVGKIAFGATQQTVVIEGQSTMLSNANVATTLPGGIFAQPSNIGRYYQSSFAVVPEIGFNCGVALTPRVNLTAGYSFLYWSRVARPGAQIDHSVHESQVPTHQFFNTAVPDGRPAFSLRQTDFWAQGISFGLEIVY